MNVLGQISQPAISDELAAQRVSGRGELSVALDRGRTRLRGLHQGGAAKIRFPAPRDSALEAVLINTAGGMTGGDRLSWNVVAEDGARVTLTTQACEKVYRASSGHAEVKVQLSAGRNARVDWLPQETIVFDRSAFSRSLEIDLAEGAAALVVEATVFGRAAMGESVARCMFRDRWRVRCGGAMIHAEDFAIGPDAAATLGRLPVTGGAIALATVLLVAPDAEIHLDAVRDIAGPYGGASSWSVARTGKLLARLVARDSYALRKRLVPLVSLLNGQAGLPKVWST